MADYFARYAADHLFDEVEEIGIRDGSNLEIPGAKGIAFGFSIWTTIEECTQPGHHLGEGQGLVHGRAVRRKGDVLPA